MEIKHIIAAALIVVLTGAGVMAACVAQRARDLMFFLMVAGATMTERLDVHFFSHAWYRGSTLGIEISLLDILAVSLLAASLLVPRYRSPRWHWPVGLGILGAYFLYCGFSVLISTPKIYGAFELTKIARGIVFFLAAASFVRTKRELRWLVLGLVCAMGLEGAIALKQRSLDGMDRVAGTLDHANSLSMYLCLVGPVLAAAATADFPRWLRRLSLLGLGVAVLTMMLTVSRAGVPILGLVVAATAAWCVSWRITFKKLALGGVLAAGAVVLVAASWKPLMARYGQASLAQEYLDDEIGNEGRGVYLRWAKMIVADHFWGLGLNNWSYGVSKTYGIREGFIYGDYDKIHTLQERIDATDTNFAAPAHSLGALTLGELGVPGLCLFALVWLRWFGVGGRFLRRRIGDPMHRLGVGIFFGTCGIFLQSLTEWVYRQAPIFITFHLLIGTLAALSYCQIKAKRSAGAAAQGADAARAPSRLAEAAVEA
jgi:O-antigen ligase